MTQNEVKTQVPEQSITLSTGEEQPIAQLLSVCALAEVDPHEYVQELFFTNPSPENFEIVTRVTAYLAYQEGVSAGFKHGFHSRDEEVLAARRSAFEFSQAVAHNVNSPLSVIRGYAELLRDGRLIPADGEAFTKGTHAIATHADMLAEGVRTLQRLVFNSEIGNVPTREELNDLFLELTETYGRGRTDYRVSYEIAEELEGLKVNSSLFDEVIKQTMSNAIKYSAELNGDSPNIYIRVYIEGDPERGFYVVYEQENTSEVPLRDDFIRSLSEPVEGNVSFARSMGVGLKITKKFCDRNCVIISAGNNGINGNPKFTYKFPVITE